MRRFILAGGVVCGAVAFCGLSHAQASAGDGVTYAYTQFDADKNCKHRKGRDVEDYGTWTCAGYAGTPVVLSAGNQRMQVSFGRRAADEVAAGETLGSFNTRSDVVSRPTTVVPTFNSCVRATPCSKYRSCSMPARV